MDPFGFFTTKGRPLIPRQHLSPQGTAIYSPLPCCAAHIPSLPPPIRSYSIPAIGSAVLSMSPSLCMDSMLVACADGRLLAMVIPSDLLLSDKDGWAGELELADVHQVHTGPVLQLHALQGEGAAVSIDPSGVIHMWSLLTGHCIVSLNMFIAAPAAQEAATAISASGSGRLVAAGSCTGGLAVFDLSTTSNRKCVFWSRLDTTPVVALAAHPSLPVFCVAFASNCVVFVSVTVAAASIIGRTFIDVPIHAVHWIDNCSPGHVLLFLRDTSLLRLSCPAHTTPHSTHCTAPIEAFDPRRVRLPAIIASLTGEISAVACRSVVQLDSGFISGFRLFVTGAGAPCPQQVQARRASRFLPPLKILRCVVSTSPILILHIYSFLSQIMSMPSSGDFKVESFSVLAFSKFSRRITCLAISNDVQNVAAGCSDGSVAVANVRDAIQTYKFVKRHEGALLGCSR